ncbi:hypothetical protein GOODEAATRI_022578 [Goodea atripinnis]|uniref:Uncharacterized protein n=1 Tax=Goodea atripinnis TaxID=208336 RepID=A0ABV0P709_9TELE
MVDPGKGVWIVSVLSKAFPSAPARQADSIKLFVVTVLWEEPILSRRSVGLYGACHSDPLGVVVIDRTIAKRITMP